MAGDVTTQFVFALEPNFKGLRLWNLSATEGLPLDFNWEGTAFLKARSQKVSCCGGFKINHWLWEEGYLVFRNGQEAWGNTGEEWSRRIDWGKTVAWAEGGGWARVFLNIRGREREGIVSPHEYEKVRSQLGHRLRKASAGDLLGIRVEKPDWPWEMGVKDWGDLMVFVPGGRWWMVTEPVAWEQGLILPPGRAGIPLEVPSAEGFELNPIALRRNPDLRGFENWVELVWSIELGRQTGGVESRPSFSEEGGDDPISSSGEDSLVARDKQEVMEERLRDLGYLN